VRLGSRRDRRGRTHLPVGVAVRDGATGQVRTAPAAALVFAGIISVQVGAGLAGRMFSQLGPAGVTGLRLWWSALIVAVFGGRALARTLRAVVADRAWRDLSIALAFGVVLGIMNFSIYQSFARIPLGVAVTIEFLGPLAVAVAFSRRWLDAVWVDSSPTGGDPDSVRGRLSLEIAQGALMILQSLAGLPAFLLYFCTAIVAVVAYLFVYTRVTPHDEFQLIRDNDPAAAIALGLSLVGFVLPVVSAIAHSANIVDCLIWSVIALIVQIAVFFIVKIPVPNLSAKIAAGELAAAIWLGLASLAAGALNAASMIY